MNLLLFLKEKEGGRAKKLAGLSFCEMFAKTTAYYDTMEHLVRHRTVTPSPNKRGRLRVVEGADPCQHIDIFGVFLCIAAMQKRKCISAFAYN